MDKLKKWLMYLVVGFFALGILGNLLPQEQQIPVKKEMIEPSTQKSKPVSHDKNHGTLVKSFGYALQASLLCDNLSMRLDTEDKIKEKINANTREGVYGEDYMFGFTTAITDDKKGVVCKEAWLHFGCNGDIEANLLQENPFKLQNPTLCKY